MTLIKRKSLCVWSGEHCIFSISVISVNQLNNRVLSNQVARGRRCPMKILITAPENENHTAPLKWALEQAGYSVACWAGPGWTEAKQASISLLPDLQIKDRQTKDTQLKLGRHLVEPGDVIWIRKPVDPKPNPQTAPEDAKFAANEYR